MRLAWFGLLAVALGTAACGRGSTASSVTVSCGDATVLVGAKYVNVIVDPGAKSTILSFPDPLNDGQTGTIAVTHRCTVSPTTEK
jgi:hypothetical protein